LPLLARWRPLQPGERGALDAAAPLGQAVQQARMRALLAGHGRAGRLGLLVVAGALGALELDERREDELRSEASSQ
jgi:hypothetical protein